MMARPLRVPTYEDKRRKRRLWIFAIMSALGLYTYCAVLGYPIPFTRYTYCMGMPGFILSEDDQFKQVEDAFFKKFDVELGKRKDFQQLRQSAKHLFELRYKWWKTLQVPFRKAETISRRTNFSENNEEVYLYWEPIDRETWGAAIFGDLVFVGFRSEIPFVDSSVILTPPGCEGTGEYND
jgi:hypothetical protein